ncbi:unnamed protein product [Adineta steineri]|uniref:Uncharacterized protein n=1 Tax=Adineta steineri TaxID=433720 RepID=A0A818Y425_9BILA|nr:unnamed protein product [Adineta steineri]CAF3749376.1 unnamed protein product [Adineta steineri]
MFSPFCTHLILIVSCVVFIFSYFSYIKRIQTYQQSLQLTSKLLTSTSNDFQNQFSSINLTTKTITDTTDEKLLREKILGSSDINHSMLSRFTFINPPKPVCNYPKYTQQFMIIVVLSRGINFDYRQVIRATWGRNGKYKNYNIFIQTIFFVGTDDTVQLAVRNEQAMFNDVVEMNIPENYPFVAHKELASLLWTRYYCPLARIIFRADDDILLDTFLLLNYIQHTLNLDAKDGLYGWFRFNNTVHRADKWAVTKLEYQPKIYPPYTFGISYLFSNVSCQRLINAANHANHQIIRIGDAYITGILRDLANIPFYDFENLQYAYTFYTEIPCDNYFETKSDLLLCMSKLHIGQRGDPYEFYDIWEIILAKHNRSISFSISTYPEILQTYDVHRLKYLSENESMTYNIYRNKINYIYIDIGCFNGETIEHFIHFTPQSILYDIITFEPDPINYQLCKQKLSQAKYRDYNIFIIPKVVWIYNGKISYQINRGQKSGIYNNKTEDTQSVVELDAIDFSSWLSNLVTLNNTKVHIRLTMPGFETRFLRKLVVDNTLLLANRWDVDWSSRSDPSVYPEHVYLHLMFDSFGFTCIGFTHLRNIRKIFKMKQPYANVTMYYNLSQLPQTDTYSHYVQRPDIGESPRTLKPAVKLKTI